MYKKIRNQNQGFTIIEVMIVLAIAGLIMMIVFLAVPALQRSSDNNARNSDAARIATAVNECIVNRNGNPDACSGTEIDSLAGTRAELTEPIQRDQPDDPGSLTQANVMFGHKCDEDGAAAVLTSNNRDFAVLYQIATGNGTFDRCVSI